MWLQAKSCPDPANRRVREARLLGHRSDRPVRCVFWHRAECSLDYRSDLIVMDSSWPARARLVQQPVDTILQEATPPFAHCMFVKVKLDPNGLAGHAIRAPQNNSAAVGQGSSHAMAANLPFEIFPFLRTQNQRGNRAPS